MSDNSALPEETKPKTHGKAILNVNMKGWPDIDYQQTSVDVQLANWYQMVDSGADPAGVAMAFLQSQRFFKLADGRMFTGLELRWARFVRLDV